MPISTTGSEHQAALGGSHRLIRAYNLPCAFEEILTLSGSKCLGRNRVSDSATSRDYQRQHRCGLRVRHFLDQGEIVLSERVI